MKQLLLSTLLLAGLAGCGGQQEEPANSKQLKPCIRQRVHIYVANRSRLDTLANLTLLVDDSLVLNQPIAFSELSSADSIKVVRLCTGAHRVRVHFGRYAYDTSFVFKQASALLMSMGYDGLVGSGSQSGLAVVSGVRQDTLQPK